MPGEDPVDCRSNKQARKKHLAGMTDTGETKPKVETCTLQLEVDVEPNQDPWISAKPPQFILHGTSNSPSSLSNVDSMGDCGSAVSPQHSTPVDVPSLPSPAPNEVTVLITGFGPFKSNLVNASYLIASSLPSSFAFPAEKDSLGAERRISLHVHPTPVPVAYAVVREKLPGILNEFAEMHNGRRPDLVIHIGLASPRPYYSVETLAHRDDYHCADIDGRAGFEDGERRWREMGLPPILTPGRAESSLSERGPYPPDDHFLETWKSFAPGHLDLRISHDPGHYLCDFIFYTSLSLALQEGQDRNVLFLHVPGGSEEADIERGRASALALIKAMVQCWIDEKHPA